MNDVFSEEILPHVNLTCVCSNKYKTGCISVNIIVPLTGKTASKNALIPRVLLRGSSRYPTMRKMNEAMDDMYGADVVPIIRKKGELQCIGFYSSFVDDDFIPGHSENLENMMRFLGELLLSPDMQGGLLNSEYVESEKVNLINEIKSAKNDKIRYAAKRLISLMCENEDYGVDVLGDVKSASEINYQNLSKQYKSIISTSRIEIIYCGAASSERVKAAAVDAFFGIPRFDFDPFIGTDVKIHADEIAPRKFTEEMDVNQGKLAIGFRVGECMLRPNYAAFLVFNALFGGSATSKLFLNVREKLSLCYYAGSSLDKYKGILTVNSGIEFSKYDEALTEILAQLDEIRKGNVSDWEFMCARRAVVNSIRTSMDTIGGLESLYFDRTVSDFKCAPEELAALSDIITLEEVIDVAKSIELDSVYFLKGKDGEDNDAE